MKRKLFYFICFALMLCLTAGGCRNNASNENVSQLRTDILFGQTEQLQITAYCETREIPLLPDGIKGEACPVVIVKISSLSEFSGTYSIFITFDGREYSAQPSQRATNVMRAEIIVDSLPAGAITLTLKGESECTVELKSIRPEGVCDYSVALKTAKDKLGESIITDKKKVVGEFLVRLLCEGENAYWYVGYVTESKTYSLLISGDGSKVLATRSADTPKFEH